MNYLEMKNQIELDIEPTNISYDAISITDSSFEANNSQLNDDSVIMVE